MGNENPRCRPQAGLHDKDDDHEALLTAIVEQLSQQIAEEALARCSALGHRSTQSAATTRRCANGDINAQRRPRQSDC